MVTPIKFGTDGWRGIIAEDYTYENLRRCAYGMARYLVDTRQNKRGLVIGYDTRFESDLFAQAAAEVVAAHGIKVYLVDKPTPTPVITYAILAQKTEGAINITASHNPPTWNGFKVRADYAGAIAPEGLKLIEQRIPESDAQVKRIAFDEGVKRGMIQV